MEKRPEGRILKPDVTVAPAGAYGVRLFRLHRRFHRAENPFTMAQFASSINKFLSFREYKILESKGRISQKAADEKAKAEYDVFNRTQRIPSDFDLEVKRLLESN